MLDIRIPPDEGLDPADAPRLPASRIRCRIPASGVSSHQVHGLLQARADDPDKQTGICEEAVANLAWEGSLMRKEQRSGARQR
ncbi:hypothetical protein ABH15_08950 [Methanoculleus taiwanensis]|uniref:Uncharacterized protein n=1 Tax=Methanoculleus taiwanensis TaxID=1550565 RepID=A0A498H2Q4_9EURY|nr:hypothetical protein [Methanoculleus taiwanensis]RXE56256.1 hypothetical protein ABH15_08950 [Methanoculleus taiwanensis]